MFDRGLGRGAPEQDHRPSARGSGQGEENGPQVAAPDNDRGGRSGRQQTGRAGRDEKEAYAVLLYNNSDEKYLKEFVELHFPNIVEIKDCYQNLANYFHLAIHNGEEENFDFDLGEFSRKYEINSLID